LIDPLAVLVGGAYGLYASAVLMVNNIRDIETDKKSGKITLAVRMGKKTASRVFILMIWLPVLLNLMLILVYPATLLGLLNLLLILPATLIVLDGRSAKELITALKLTSFAGLGFGVLIGFGIFAVNLGL
jgi:1,4-dihydroxy-2-naphthoate octaprenyltransferase